MKKGFSIIELIVSLSIISIISVCAIPCSKRIYEENLNNALKLSMNELLMDIKYTQKKAMTDGYICSIEINEDDNLYLITSFRDMKLYTYKKKVLPKGISFDKLNSSYSNKKISFNSAGKPLPYPCTIALKNKLNYYKEITITVGSDYISIK